MFEDLRSFVPSEICLSCQGCCRFEDKKSPWRPKMSKEEISSVNRSGLPTAILSDEALDRENYLRTVVNQGETMCQFFLHDTNTCGIYKFHPLECRLYPFVLVSHKKKINIAAHKLCPFVSRHLESEEFIHYMDYLESFLNSPEVSGFIQRNKSLIGDYEDYQDEFQYLFILA